MGSLENSFLIRDFTMREDYLLTTNDITSRTINLNGKLLEVTDDGTYPELLPYIKDLDVEFEIENIKVKESSGKINLNTNTEFSFSKNLSGNGYEVIMPALSYGYFVFPN